MTTDVMLNKSLSHRERMERLLAGEEIDRTPVSFWRHFYHLEQNAHDLAKAMLDFQKKFDWDFMKVNPRASYHAQPWGAVVQYSKDEFTKTEIVDYPVKRIEDWKAVEPVPATQGSFGEQLQALSIIGREVKKELFFVETVFSPLSVAGYLVEEMTTLSEHLRDSPELIHRALEAITLTFERFVEEVQGTGASGIFFATTHWASKDYITREEYLEFARPYDLRVLARAKEAKFNVLHVCEANNLLELFKDYPAQVVNWDATHPSNLDLIQGEELLGKAVLGGINHNQELLDSDPSKVTGQANSLRHKMDGRPWILGPGCSIPPETPGSNLARLRNLVEEWR